MFFDNHWYDYGARFYDPTLGRWHVFDAMYDKHYDIAPYTYVLNNPILLIDPIGLTDYKYDKESGDVTQVGEANDEPDRILKTREYGKHRGEIKHKRNGEAKVAIGDIEKGILSDGMNFKTDDNIIQVGSEDQPGMQDVQEFIVDLSDYIDKEIAGIYISGDNQKEPSAVYIDEYQGNTSKKATITIDLDYIGSAIPHTSFHSHLSRFDATYKYVPSEQDRNFKKGQKDHFRRFIILTDHPDGPIEY